MRAKFLFLLFAGIQCVYFFSCSEKSIDIGLATPYFPSMQTLKKGMVYKFYVHSIPKNKDKNTSTDIAYFKYQFEEPNLLTCSVTDAAFKPVWYKKYEVADEKLLTKEYFEVIQRDTGETKIIENVEMDWANATADIESTMLFKKKEIEVNISRKQVGVTDTIVAEMPAKNFSLDVTGFFVHKGDTTEVDRKESHIYAHGIGLFSRWSERSEYTIHHELVEQMSVEEYENRMAKTSKRIAYIDPNNTMDDTKDFKICGDEEMIGDYYNGGLQRGELNGGKGSWWRILKRDLKPALLHQESGYLTFRFVINCNGEVGRIITEETGLDFKKKKFNEETVQHLYEILYSQEDWNACVLRGEKKDSYTYITFKLQNGKIIELLP